MEEIRPTVYTELIDQIKAKYPETQRMSATGVVDWALRQLLKEEADSS